MTRALGMTAVLIAAAIVLGYFNPDFWSGANLSNVIRQIALLSILAIGMSFVIITGGIDLSVGAMVGLVGVTVAALITGGMTIVNAVVLAIALSLVMGFVQGLLITRLNLQPFIVTLAGMLIFRGIAQTITQGGTISLGDSPLRDLADGGLVSLGNGWLLSYPVIILITVFAAAAFALHGTKFGRYLYAIGGNRDAALYAGISVKRVETFAYVISAGLAGLAGVAYAAYIGQMSHTVGTAYELVAIAAAVLGGCSLRGGEGTIAGVVAGASLMKLIENAINMFKVAYTNSAGVAQEWRPNTNWQYIIVGGVILIAVMLDAVGHRFRGAMVHRALGKSTDGHSCRAGID